MTHLENTETGKPVWAKFQQEYQPAPKITQRNRYGGIQDTHYNSMVRSSVISISFVARTVGHLMLLAFKFRYKITSLFLISGFEIISDCPFPVL